MKLHQFESNIKDVRYQAITRDKAGKALNNLMSADFDLTEKVTFKRDNWRYKGLFPANPIDRLQDMTEIKRSINLKFLLEMSATD